MKNLPDLEAMKDAGFTYVDIEVHLHREDEEIETRVYLNHKDWGSVNTTGGADPREPLARAFEELLAIKDRRETIEGARAQRLLKLL